ncbi:hypothetical protein FOA52_004243 [Chlamydomonas sp. UWO 241]|nr:hypothetical protein FOA52_004243 [Chlamydomonas sp. UWO 241]
MSCINLYELDLRGNKIAAIENLGVTQNQFDSIDLSDNAIVKLEGFPRLLRLKQLLLNNNRLTRIGKKLEDTVPGIETLILTNNKLSSLSDLEPLSSLSKLTMLSLMGNPVATKPNYRLYVISRCKALKVLDFKKVKAQDRKDAEAKFPTDEAAAEEATKTFEPEEDLAAAKEAAGVADADAEDAAMADGDDGKPKAPTQAQLVAVKAAIANATTLEEISRLENALTTGQLPSEFTDGQDSGTKPDSMEVG